MPSQGPPRPAHFASREAPVRGLGAAADRISAPSFHGSGPPGCRSSPPDPPAAPELEPGLFLRHRFQGLAFSASRAAPSAGVGPRPAHPLRGRQQARFFRLARPGGRPAADPAEAPAAALKRLLPLSHSRSHPSAIMCSGTTAVSLLLLLLAVWIGGLNVATGGDPSGFMRRQLECPEGLGGSLLLELTGDGAAGRFNAVCGLCPLPRPHLIASHLISSSCSAPPGGASSTTSARAAGAAGAAGVAGVAGVAGANAWALAWAAA